jgi:tetratricopeptide (TPR) repeat protein
MMRGLLRLRGTFVACAGAALAISAAPVAAQGSYSQYDETATAALARYVRTLASDPKDFTTLIGAGRAALEVGDAQAAAGFFARADDVNPHSPLPQAGMGAVSVANGDAQASLPYFERARQLGATLVTIGCYRGLAYDLLGRQADAQADYRAAMNGPDRDEARRRLALSLAISGNRDGALQTIAPLAAKGDPGVPRIRAFVLALTGDSNAAILAINAVMPGRSASVAPFLQRLPALSAGQKAAAVNLGIFPDANGTAYAYAAPQQPIAPVMSATRSDGSDRLAGIDAMLRGPAAPSVAQARPVQVAYAAPPTPAVVQRTTPAAPPRIWLQLASGSDVDGLAGRFRQMKSKSPDLFDGIKPYVARSGSGALLLIGPFRGPSDAEIFAEDLETVGVDASKFIDSQNDRIAPLASE